MRQRARHIVAGGLVVLLAEYLRIGCVAGVVEPSIDSEPPIVRGKRTKCHHRGTSGRSGPLRKIDFLRGSGQRLRQEALRGDIEDSGAAQVVEKGGIKSGLQ